MRDSLLMIDKMALEGRYSQMENFILAISKMIRQMVSEFSRI
jgi:hypothetical protein